GEGDVSTLPSREDLGTAGFGKLGGRIANGISKAQRGETPLGCAHVSYGTTSHVVSFVESEDWFQRRECHAGRAVRPRFGARVHEVPMGISRRTLQRHAPSCCPESSP